MTNMFPSLLRNDRSNRRNEVHLENREISPRPVISDESDTIYEQLQKGMVANETEKVQNKTKIVEERKYNKQINNGNIDATSSYKNTTAEDPRQPNYFSFVIDTTADMSLLYYPQIHNLLTSAIERIERLHIENGFKAMIGITTFHTDPTGEDDKLGDDFFTQDFNAVRKRIDNLKFFGGDQISGRECIDEAQKTALERMAKARINNDKLAANCSQILITSSLPKLRKGESDESEHSFDFTEIEGIEESYLGLRFALNIVLDKKYYSPIFKMVDSMGDKCTTKGNLCKICDLKEILNGEIEDASGRIMRVDEPSDVISNILTELLKQTSLYSD